MKLDCASMTNLIVLLQDLVPGPLLCEPDASCNIIVLKVPVCNLTAE